MTFKELSIKNFISDLPRIINNNFKVVKTFIEKVFTENESNITIGSEEIHVTGKFVAIDVNDIKAGNIKILENGEYISLHDYIQSIVESEVERAIQSASQTKPAQPER